MDPSPSSRKFTREELSIGLKEYFARNPQMYQQLLSMDEQKLLDTKNPLGKFLAKFRSSAQGRFMSVDPLTPGATADDPQSLNRFTYALNNPLRHTDLGVMQNIDAWSLLTPEEQAIISDKLSRGVITDRRGRQRQETYREAFNRAIESGTDEEIKNKVTLVKNFIDTAGGHTNSAIWQEIVTFERAWLGSDHDKKRNDPRFHKGGGVTFLVKTHSTFLDVLEKNNYVKNPWYDKHFNKEAHPNDSAREKTETSYETGAHMSNDDSKKLDRFLLHWDKRSTEFKKRDSSKYWSVLTEQRDAGKSHYEPFSATEAREGLRKRGVVPARER